METSITKEQARARRKHFGRQNSDPFYTMSYTSKAATQDKNVPSQPEPHAPEDLDKEVPAKELATA